MSQGVQCIECKHYLFNRRCKAFDADNDLAESGKIPMEIFSGEFNHLNPYPSADNPQDNGIRFEPIEEQQ